jgi:hypothetical protein
MTQESSQAVNEGLLHLRKTYGFLLAKGYEVLSAEAEDAGAGWRILLGKGDLIIRIRRTFRGETVYFHSAAQRPAEFTDVGSAIYAATGERIPVSYEGYARELQKYLERIEAYFETDYPRDPDRLGAARQEYLKTPPGSRPQSRSWAGAALPREPVRFPILYYPLMAAILLLLFLALTTLYAVLLDRLFASFSLDSDVYTPFMGAGAFLLSIGTLLLFRRRRQRG